MKLNTLPQFTYQLSVLILVLFLAFNQATLVNSKASEISTLDAIGTDSTTNIYPASFVTEDWVAPENALSPDLNEDSIYQKFNSVRAAYLNLKEGEEVSEAVSGFDSELASAEVLEVDNQTATSTEVADESVEDSVETTDEEAEPVEDLAPVVDSSSTTVSVYREATEAVFAFFSQVTDYLPFATESTTTATELIDDDIEKATSSEPAPEINDEDELPEEILPEEDLLLNESATSSDSEIEPILELVPKVEIEDELATSTTLEELIPASTSTEFDAIVETVDLATTTATTSETEAEAEFVLPDSYGEYKIKLSDFSMPELKTGEYITGVQLRASLGAKAKITSDSAVPFFKLVYKTPSSTIDVGSVLIDNEASNALNAGYYLFALPEINSVEDFSEIEIEVVLVGDKNDLEGAFLDSVWLEVNTKRITKADLLKKMNQDLEKKFAKAKAHEFVSKQFNFSRFENPVFNLRYESQRSKPVETLRALFGKNKVKVGKVDVLHQGAGLVGVKPEVNVTKDGLVSIAVSDEDKKKLKPGVYTVEVEIEEGGYRVVDSFDFQWGMLSINSNQTEYSVGDEAFISMGALTPNGNTLCEANLNLYVVDPGGFLSKVPVEQSGKCEGNNVIDVPDYFASYEIVDVGVYEMILERVDEAGEVISYTSDTFLVEQAQSVVIERNGPTRIYPPSPYAMELTVKAVEDAFSGELIEIVPADFAVTDTDAEIDNLGTYKELKWQLDVDQGKEVTVSYQFDAPDLSPFLYELGPAELISDRKVVNKKKVLGVSTSTTATTSASSTQIIDLDEPEEEVVLVSEVKSQSNNSVFLEHRQWQIASDATGNMVLFYAGTGGIPAGWSCLSCGSGTFYQRFAVGSSTYNNTGGSANHSHTGTGSVINSSLSATESGSGTIAPVSHTHTYTPTISTETNLPEYRQLRVIQYTVSAGEPANIPDGAVAIFDVASSSLPANWVRYAAQDGYFIYAEDTVGTVNGSSTYPHTISGTTGAAAGSDQRTRGGTTVPGAASGHTHTVSGQTTVDTIEPPYIEVVLGYLTATSTPVNSIISMWTEDVPSGWIDLSSDGASAFNNRFLKASTTYGATGGASTHSHSDVTGITSSVPNATTPGRVGAAGADGSHTHAVNVTGISTENNLPPFISVVIGKKQGTDPIYDQTNFRWYVNENAQTPNDPWPSGVDDLLEAEPITATSTVLGDGDVIRLRMNVGVTNATSTVGSRFKLQYAATNNCSAGIWQNVGDTSSTTAWRGYNNAGVSDHSTLSSTVLSASDAAETYEENGYATGTPNQIGVDEFGEWDYVLQNYAAATGTSYCFRMVEDDGTAFSSYSSYPRLLTDSSPSSPTLDILFNYEKTATTSSNFRFVTTDPEGADLHYQIQFDDDYGFGSTLEDRNSITNSSQFENLVVPADKAPFTSGQQMEFTPVSNFVNGTTYYWRVRAQDPDGSNDWGDWSEIRSFTIDTALTASAWFQTETEQFDGNTLVGIDTASDQMDLASGSTTGTSTSPAIDFTDGSNGTAWDSLVVNETDSGDVIDYRLQYYSEGVWDWIPNSDLPGNAAGFASSTILLALDVETYSVIRIVAIFTGNTGTPSIQSWGVDWGYRVETPTIVKLFPNEKVGTTTPIFEFSTTDPQSDSLTYEISWSTDNTFTSSTTRNSTTTPDGFSNIDNGGDVDPFDSGDSIQYEIQPADALTNGNTYWWRVRAKDTTGDDAWSFWTDPRSFTVDNTVTASTWFQTTEEQFDTNILSGTVSQVSDSVTVATTATEAMLIYGEGTATEPRYRQWNGTSWTTESTMSDIGAALVWGRVEAAPTREEFVAVTVGTDADVNAQVFSTGAWGDQQEMTTNMGDISSKGFDVTYETLSGDALVVYCNNTADPSYYVWDGSGWTSGGTITVAENSNCDWIQLASDPVSNEIIMLMRGTDGNPFEAWVWNGTTDTWGNSTTIGNITEAAHEGMAVAYEESGNQAIILASDGNPARFEYNTWNGTTWGTSATQGVGDDFEWGTLVADEGSDELALCYQDEDTNIGYVRWTGSAWAGQGELLTTTGKSKVDPGFSCVFESAGTRDNYIMVAYTDTAATNYAHWDNTNWTDNGQINSIGDTITSELQRTGDGTILGIFFDETGDDLLATEWDGSSWSTTAALEDDVSVDTTPYGRPYSLAPRNPGSEGTTIVSPGIDFSDGNGPYWQEMSWVDSTPGSSDILYSVQYWDGDSWELIPDLDLPGNSTGTSTSPINLSGLNQNTYDLIRPYAALTCDGSNNCPSLQDWTVTWAEGIAISGTLQAYDQTTNVNSGTIAVAVNGVLQTGKTGTVSGGTWTIPNVTVFSGDIITVFVNGTNPGDVPDANEAVGVTIYDGVGDINGFQLYERHVTLGSNDATSTPLTNADIASYTATQDEDVFLNISGSVLEVCSVTGCSDAELFINASTTYQPGGNVITHDLENNGTLIATSTLYLTGSWDNNATTTLTGSTVVMTATSTTEGIDSTGAVTSNFNNLTFGTTTGSATWYASSTLDVDGDLLVDRGTLNRNTAEITIAGDLTTGANGSWSGVGTTTFDNGGSSSWSDQNATLQNVGYLVVDGSGKIVSLGSDVAAQSITIGADDTLDASAAGNYDIYVYEDWTNNNTFLPRNGAVVFSGTTGGLTIDDGGEAFYDLTFNGAGGSWSFINSTLAVDNDFTVATGTVTMTTATTSVSGSWNTAGGTFVHNNSVVDFTGSGAETITASGTDAINAFYNLSFSGGGTWSFNDLNATSSNDVYVSLGDVTFPSGYFTIGGSLYDTGGSFIGNNGTVRFDSGVAESIQAGGSSFSSLMIDGAGTFTFLDINADINDDVIVNTGTLVLPSGTLTVGGSWTNTASVNANSGTVEFDSADTGETVNFGTADMYDVAFDSTTGGWTIATHATATNNFSLTNASDFTLASGQVLSVGADFSNLVGGASTTWNGSTLSLENGSYAINTKALGGDSYETLRIDSTADISMWNSAATTTTVISGGSLYSQDHAAVDGELYIFGDYTRTVGAEHWSYATDFDGTDLSGGSERQAQVYFAAGASATISGVLFEAFGSTAATTTVTNQGSGTYTVDVNGGTTTMQYYDLADLGITGLSLLASTTVTSLRDGAYTVAAPGGVALTVSSTTIDTNPALQIYDVIFATTTAISADNVAQTDGTPASYWWFRESKGNLDGEAQDNDTGNPGSIRWDDSALVLNISGVVYTDDGVTPLTGGTCNGVANSVRIVVNGDDSSPYDGSCSAADGSFSIGGVTVVGDQTLTVFLNGASGGERAVAVTKTPTADVSDLDLYVNRVITRHEDILPMTTADMALYDSVDDSDLLFTAATGTLTDTLTLVSDSELYVWATTTFTPGGTVTLSSGGTGNTYDGSLYLGNGATFTGAGTTTHYIGGSLTLEKNATYVPASTTIQMTATTSGKTVSVATGDTLTVDSLEFVGTGGTWNINGDITASSDILVSAGTVTGTGNITLTSGSFYGNGLVSLGGGLVTIEEANTLGGTQGWTFNDLTLGNGSVVGTTTPGSNATTTVGGTLTIANAHFLDAGASYWDLSGTGVVFIETGNLLEDTSTFTYSGTGPANVISTDYYNLVLSAQGSSPTYTVTGLGMQVFGDMQVGGASTTVLTLDTNDPALNVDGNLTINSNGTLIASDSGSFTLAGSYDNNGVFTANSGTLTFDGSGAETIAAGSSVFANALVTGTGDYTVTEHATSMSAFTIGSGVGSFTLDSGQVLSVTGAFSNELGGTDTTWTGSTLHLFGGGNYEINSSTTDDVYNTLLINDTTQIRMWNSRASTVTTAGSGSLYSMDHDDNDGDLYIYGDYNKTSGVDHWSYTTDFDGSDLSGGSERKVDVFVLGGDSVRYSGTGQLSILGAAAASTTVQNQGSGVVAFDIASNASTTMNYYEMTDLDADGLTFSGSPTVVDLSYGYFLVANDNDSAITVGGTAIDASPALTFTNNIFATSSGVTTAVNVTATGTSVSSWRFTAHTGDIDGEDFDVDPDGDPGYVVWSDSAALITVAGNVYENDESTTSSVCDGATQNIVLYVEGNPEGTASCNGTTGAYSITDVSYSAGNSLVVFISGEADVAATVSEDPVSNINNMDLYEDHVIVRHEGVDPLSISDMAVYDSSDDADIPFTAVTGSPDTLSLPADTKLLVWDSKEFEPSGNVTVTGGGAGAAYDGTVELRAGATFTANSGETLSIGGSLLSGVGATYSASTATTTFTATGASRTIDINDGSFYNVSFTGSGSWSVTDTIFDINNLDMTAGTLTLPTGTTTVSGYFDNSGGTLVHNGSLMVFDGSGVGNTVTFNDSTVSELRFTGSGSWTMDDTNATSTDALTVTDGTLTLPSGTLALGGSFRNEGGSITHNTSHLLIGTSSAATLLSSSSDLYSVTFRDGGTFTLEDVSSTLLGDLTIESGSLALATGTLSVGGSFDASGGTFTHGTGTILFNSADTGETIDPGTSDFYNLVFSNGSGGWTITADATTTNNFTLTAANTFVQQTGTRLYVGGVFDNSVGGTETDWNGSTLVIDSGSEYELNAKTDNGDEYDTLIIGTNTDLSAWFSRATTTIVDSSSSFYSQDHGDTDGALYIYGDYHIGTTTEYWSYATDFDGASLSGSERAVTVSIASGATTTLKDSGTLNIVGSSGNETTVTNQGSGTYDFNVTGGTLNATYYAFRNLNSNGLTLTGTPLVSSLSYGDFELAVNGGRLINLSSTTLNTNASLVIAGNRFATTTAITGTNVYLTGDTDSAWTFTAHTGNLAGENYDVDGATDCGQIRFDNSTCQLIQQTNYRWRNDDGGLGVVNTEWMNANWDARKSVRIDNPNSTTTADAVVELKVVYDTDMQADFDDLRFTDSSGTTTIPHFIASTTNSVAAEVWVKVPSLPANDTAVVYMYYNHPTASSTSSSTLTFIAADDFEDNDIAEYQDAGDDKGEFAVNGTFAYGGSYGLDVTDGSSRTEDGGMARFDQTVSQGETIRYMQYVDTTGGDDEVCTMFGVQSPASGNQNYAICLEQVIGTDYMSITEDVVDTNENSGTELATTSVTYSDGWYEIEVDWGTDDVIFVSLYDDAGSLVATTSATDSTKTSGGYGFTYWFNEGGWDNFTSRPTLTAEPTVRFGVEVTDGGATWAAEQNTAMTAAAASNVRLRLGIENSGLSTTTDFTLEYAAKGAAPSCESISGASYSPVPTQATCGTSAICMQSTTYYADGAATADLLTGTEGTFTAGEAVENPSNDTGSLTVGANEYTELEFNITPTVSATDSRYCLRVGAGGGDLDTYLRVAELLLRFDPVLGIVYMDDRDGVPDINLVGGTTTRVYATSTVSDVNGYSDLVAATTTFYLSDVTAACAEDPNSCYIATSSSQCSFTNCAGDSCVLECYADFQYHASPTDEFGGKFWYAFMEVADTLGGTDFDTSAGQDIITLNALAVEETINYGALAVYSTTTAFSNPTTTLENIGNNFININLEGTDLTDGGVSAIPANKQRFATSSFNYNSCTYCTNMSTTTILNYDLDLVKPTTTAVSVTDTLYWGIVIPFGVASNPHSGVNTFYAVSD